MHIRISGIAALTALFGLAACSKTITPLPPPAPPRILSFTADARVVNKGASVKLTFTTENATEVVLLDQLGNEVQVTGTVAQGDATVTPQSNNAFYVLRANGEGGTDSAFVQVGVNAPLETVFLVAVPPVLKAGEKVSLLYSAEGGSSPTLTDSSGMSLPVTQGSGVVTDTPKRSTTYTFKATGPQGAVTATAKVQVVPVISELKATPATASLDPADGKRRITLVWKTAGGDSLELAEATFGVLHTTTNTTDVASGSFTFVVPDGFLGDAGTPDDAGTRDGGAGPRPIGDRYPLSFTVTVKTNEMPAQEVSKTLLSVVGDGPAIINFQVPPAVTDGKPLEVSWAAVAHRAQLWLDGKLVFETVPPASANGALALPSPKATTQVTLRVFDFAGFSTEETRTVKSVRTPVVKTFTVPSPVARAGDAVTASWSTENATQVVLRVKNGPVLFTTKVAGQVTQGMAPVVPTRSQTLVLEAYNDANDFDAKPANVVVSAPANTSANPDPAAPGYTVQLAWDVASIQHVDVVGLPVPTATSASSAISFIDLDLVADAETLSVTNRDDGYATVKTRAGFTFPFLGVMRSTFAASVNGALVLGESAPALKSNVNLATVTTSPPPPLLAPFWDDLHLGTFGSIKQYVEGSTFPRRLIVQWSKVTVGGNSESELTFQVQLFESGEVRYAYKTLADPNGASTGSGATVGIFGGLGVFGTVFSHDQAVLSEGQLLTWLTQGTPTGTLPVTVTGPAAPGFFLKLQNAQYAWVFQPLRVFTAGAVTVNEAMPVPAQGVPMGQWVELYNPSGIDIDLSGLALSADSAPSAPYIFPPATVMAPGTYLVLGQTTSALDNDDAGVALAWASGEVPLARTDKASLTVAPTDGGIGGFLVSQLAWADAGTGVSAQYETVRGTVTGCMRKLGYGTQGGFGSPGKANESCFPYAMSSIPASYEYVTANPPLFAAGFDEQILTVPITPAFNAFGNQTSSLSVAVNGFMTFAAGSTNTLTNRSVWPATANPMGVLAPFWDDLSDEAAAPDANVYVGRVGDHVVVQWHHVSHYNTAPADDLNFEVKLFDNGVIEIHYGDMVSGTSTDYANGNSATVCLETPNGSAAMVPSANQPLVRPNSAIRFTPIP